MRTPTRTWTRTRTRGRAVTRERWMLAAILGVGLLLRLTYLLEVSRAPDFGMPRFEAQYHDYWARALLSGDWTPPPNVTDPEIHHRPYFRPPGYPYFLSLVYRLAGLGYQWPRVAQMLMGLASCLLLYQLARAGFGSATALFAAALAAVYWIFIFFEAELMAVSLLVLLMLAALALAARWPRGLTAVDAAVVGLLIGLATLVRPNAAVLVPALTLWAGWLAWRRGGRASLTRASLLRPVLALVAAAVLTTLPATVRNYAVARDWVWITSNAGINLFVGTHPDSDGTRPGVAELGEIAGLESGWDSFDYPLIAAGVERGLGRPVSDSEVSAYFTRRAFGYAVSEPVAVARLTLRKLALFWGPAEVSNNKVIELEREASPTLRLSPDFATILALALAGISLGVWQHWKGGGPVAERERRLEIGALLIVVVAIYCASFLPFFVSARFRAPVIPALMVFAGYALARVWQALAGRNVRRLGAGVALIAALRALTGVAWVPYEPDRGLWHWRQGLLWQARGDAGQALDAFRRAAVEDPDDPRVRLSLAETLAAAGRDDEAIVEYRATLALTAPTSTAITAHNNLARMLAGRGEVGAAVEHWNSVLELDPDRASALNNLAYALATHPDPERRDPERAVALAERAVELTGGADPRPLAALAAAYRAAGREGEAEEILRRAQDPSR